MPYRPDPAKAEAERQAKLRADGFNIPRTKLAGAVTYAALSDSTFTSPTTHPDSDRPRTDPLDLWLNTSRSADEPGACALCELPWTKGQWIGTVRIASRTFWCHVACANRYRPTSNQARHRKVAAR